MHDFFVPWGQRYSAHCPPPDVMVHGFGAFVASQAPEAAALVVAKFPEVRPILCKQPPEAQRYEACSLNEQIRDMLHALTKVRLPAPGE